MTFFGLGVFSPLVLKDDYLPVLAVGNYLPIHAGPFNVRAAYDGIRTVINNENLFYLNVFTFIDGQFLELNLFSFYNSVLLATVLYNRIHDLTPHLVLKKLHIV